MSWLLATLRSSVGKKFVMGCTGLFLCFFLVVHLAGNLLLYKGPKAYNDYANALHANVPFLIVAEVGLFGAMLAHIYLAFTTAAENRAARGTQGYAVRQSKISGRVVNFLGLAPDTTMFLTGALIFAYLCIHLCDFKFEVFSDEATRALDPYSKAAAVLSQGSRKLIYGIAALIVGIHVSHGFQSAFQSLGLYHPKYTPSIKNFSKVFGVLVALGFCSFAFWDSNRARQGDDAEKALPGKAIPQTTPTAYVTPPDLLIGGKPVQFYPITPEKQREMLRDADKYKQEKNIREREQENRNKKHLGAEIIPLSASREQAASNSTDAERK